VCAYSNSKPTISIPAPTANPLVALVVGVEFVPMNAVRSADALAGTSRQRKRVKGRR
jgi:hypothetical protein